MATRMPSRKVLQELDGLEGLWVAIIDSGIVAKGHDAKRVLQGANRKTKEEVTIFKVPLREEEAHVL